MGSCCTSDQKPIEPRPIAIPSSPSNIQSNIQSNQEQINDFDTQLYSYFDHIQSLLKTENFTYGDLESSNAFANKLTTCYEITPEQAQIWTESYQDYMIFLGFLGCDDPSHIAKYSGIAPYAIIQTWKIHLLYTSNYRQFSNIITGGKLNVIPFTPLKPLTHGIFDISFIKSIYKSIKSQICQGIYSSSMDTGKTQQRRKDCSALWTDFDEALIKCELLFCFLDETKKSIFFNALELNASELRKSKDIYEPIRIRETLRNILFLDISDNIDNKNIPYLQTEFLADVLYNESDQDLCQKIDNIIFPDYFMKILCIEQLLTVEETIKHILEYKKFLFILLRNTDHNIILTPSEKINQVWHLHLQHTEDYQKYVNIIREVPYVPFNSRISNDLSNAQSYSQTLDLYTRYFGNPVGDLWPKNVDRATEFGIWRDIFNQCYKPNQSSPSNRSVPKNQQIVNPNVKNLNNNNKKKTKSKPDHAHKHKQGSESYAYEDPQNQNLALYGFNDPILYADDNLDNLDYNFDDPVILPVNNNNNPEEHKNPFNNDDKRSQPHQHTHNQSQNQQENFEDGFNFGDSNIDDQNANQGGGNDNPNGNAFNGIDKDDHRGISASNDFDDANNAKHDHEGSKHNHEGNTGLNFPVSGKNHLGSNDNNNSGGIKHDHGGVSGIKHDYGGNKHDNEGINGFNLPASGNDKKDYGGVNGGDAKPNHEVNEVNLSANGKNHVGGINTHTHVDTGYSQAISGPTHVNSNANDHGASISGNNYGVSASGGGGGHSYGTSANSGHGYGASSGGYNYGGSSSGHHYGGTSSAHNYGVSASSGYNYGASSGGHHYEASASGGGGGYDYGASASGGNDYGASAGGGYDYGASAGGGNDNNNGGGGGGGDDY